MFLWESAQCRQARGSGTIRAFPDAFAPRPLTSLHILWRDEHLVAVYKPAGWLVHRTGLDAGETRFVMQTLRDQLGQHV